MRLGGPAAMNADTRTLVSQATRRISRARSAFVNQGLAVIGSDPEGLGALTPVALQVGEALNPDLTAQGVADDLTSCLAQALGKSVSLLSEVVG